MNRTIITISAGVVAFGLGVWTGWTLKNRHLQKIADSFEETTEEDLQAYAEQFEDKKEETVTVEEPVPTIEVEGTNVSPALDTRKVDFANAWKEGKDISKREGYGEPSPGDEEDLNPTNMELDPDFNEAIQNTGPRFEAISGKKFYTDDDRPRKVFFWYDRDDVVTTLGDDDEEIVVSDPRAYLDTDIRNLFAENADSEELEIAGAGVNLYLEDTRDDELVQLVRYPMSYGKRSQQEVYGGTDIIERMHQRGSIL